MSVGEVSKPPRILHVGCGNGTLPEWIGPAEETRLDIDPDCRPDIVSSIIDLGAIGGFDRVFSSHCLEHIYPHEVPVALGEFRRVLRVGGAAVVLVPDLDDIKPTTDVVYEAPCGPVTGLDMFYGFRPYLKNNPFYAHHTGFVKSTLYDALYDAGFANVVVERVVGHQLMAVAVK